MGLQQTIEDNYKAAFKAGQKAEVIVLRSLKSAMKNEEIALKKTVLDDEDVIKVLNREVKRRKDALVMFQKGNRLELAEIEQIEINFLKKYLPEELSAGQLNEIISQVIKQSGATELSDLGKVMSRVMLKVQGRADGSAISAEVKKQLSGYK
ncbi:MAG: GatB/YqeY domain-containing protein [bacterium]